MFPIALPTAAPAALLRASPAARTGGHLWFGYAFSIVQACSARRSCHHGLLARQAFLQYGRGRHPARLNFGDCFPYALAKVRRDTFLSKAKTSQRPTSFPPGNLTHARSRRSLSRFRLPLDARTPTDQTPHVWSPK